MDQINILNQSSAILLTLGISIIFVIIGLVYSKKYQGLNNYLVASRSIGTFSLTASLVASALGAWILFGPASAATWGGVGAVIGGRGLTKWSCTGWDDSRGLASSSDELWTCGASWLAKLDDV